LDRITKQLFYNGYVYNIIINDNKNREEEKVTVGENVKALKNTNSTSIVESKNKSSKKHYEIDEHIHNLKKYDAAKLLLKKANFLVNDVDNQMCSCQILFDKDLEAYEKAKKLLYDHGLDSSNFLLSQLCYVEDKKHQADDDILVFKDENTRKPPQIKKVYNAKIMASVLALFSALSACITLLLFAVEQLHIVSDITAIPLRELVNPVLNWYASQIGMDDRPLVGALMLSTVLLLLMWGIYTLYVRLKENSNLNRAKEQLLAAEAYCAGKASCKEQMKRADAFIHKAINTLHLYQGVLDEQQVKLKHILHTERDKIFSQDFLPESLDEMKKTRELINYIKDFMTVNMLEEGKLSAKSGLFLLRAQNRITKVIH